MSASRRARTIFALLTGLLLLYLYLRVAIPSQIAIGTSCEPSGIVASMKEAVEGPAFWRGQLAAIDAWIALPGEVREARAKVQPIFDSVDAQFARTRVMAESIYVAHPEARPAPAPLSQKLREEADRQQRREDAAFTENAIARVIREVAACRSTVAERGGIRG